MRIGDRSSPLTRSVPNQPSGPGEEWARRLLFGADTSRQTPPKALASVLATCATDAADALARAALEVEAESRVAEHRGSLGSAIRALTNSSARSRAAAAQLLSRDVDRPFRVVLMGRTMAGKSTLFEYLSAGDGARVGDGRQRYTRKACVRVAADIGLEIVDTPGVGAMDGESDYEAAFLEVADADLILWVATDQATQEQTGRALEHLADMGKPVIVALNCLADINNEIGLLDMLEEPYRVFGGGVEDNLAPIGRHLAAAGGRYIDAVAIHAQAALVSSTGSLDADDARALLRNSRIDLLISALRLQRDRTAEQRRTASICDFLRVELLDAGSELSNTIGDTRSMLKASVGSQREFRKRAIRRVEDACEELKAAFAGAAAARERWVESVDVDQTVGSINKQWDEEVAALRSELGRSVTDIGDRLQSDLKRIAVDVADDWAEFDAGNFLDLGGRGAMWGNRAVKVGGRVAAGMGGAALGAKVGALVGTALGPGPGTAIGLGVGAIIGLVSGILGADRAIDLLGDRLFRSASATHERRRQKVRDQFSPLLKELRMNLESAADKVRRDWLSAVECEFVEHSAASAAIERALIVLERALTDELDPTIARIDAELARELLRNIGRERAASSVGRVTRWRGAGIAVDMPEPEFSELVLFPTADIVERIVPTAAHSFPAARSLQIIRCLAGQAVAVHQMGHDSLSVSLGAVVSAGVRESWEALARLHAGADIRVVTEGIREGVP